MVLPVPKPIGGVLLFAANTITYANQSVPSLCIAVNSIAQFSTEVKFSNYLFIIIFYKRIVLSNFFFTTEYLEDISLSLDCSNADFIEYDKLVLSLKGGEL